MHQEYSPEIVLSSEECGLVLMSNVMFSGTKSCLGLPLSGRKFSLQKVISRGLRNTWVGSGEGLGVENNQKIPHTTNIQNPNQLYRCRQLHEETTLNPHRSRFRLRNFTNTYRDTPRCSLLLGRELLRDLSISFAFCTACSWKCGNASAEHLLCASSVQRPWMCPPNSCPKPALLPWVSARHNKDEAQAQDIFSPDNSRHGDDVINFCHPIL